MAAPPAARATPKIHALRGIVKVPGWIKPWGGTGQFKVRGTGKVISVFGMHLIAYKLIRLDSLLKSELIVA